MTLLYLGRREPLPLGEGWSGRPDSLLPKLFQCRTAKTCACRHRDARFHNWRIWRPVNNSSAPLAISHMLIGSGTGSTSKAPGVRPEGENQVAPPSIESA